MANVLTAAEFLGLAELHTVARVDLSEVGRDQVSFVRALTTAEKHELVTIPRQGQIRKVKRNRDRSTELEFNQAVQDAAPSLIRRCLVTDSDGGKWLESEFERLGNPETIEVKESELIQMEDVMLNSIMSGMDYDPNKARDVKLAEERASKELDSLIGKLGNQVTNLYMRYITDVSGLNDEPDDDEEANDRKKG